VLAHRVAELLDLIEHVLPGFLACFVGPAPDALTLASDLRTSCSQPPHGVAGEGAALTGNRKSMYRFIDPKAPKLPESPSKSSNGILA